VKGIEPSYSAWKAAALPLSYTRVKAINYHAAIAASTAMNVAPQAGIGRMVRLPPALLTEPGSVPILGFPSTMKGGDPVSYSKRCHLAGIAR
jgi:hypothetical protein